MDALNKFLKNKYVTGAVMVLAVFYASLLRPQLPVFIHDLFDNAAFRLLVLTFIAYVGSQNLQVSIVLAIVFMLTLQFIGEQKMTEGFIGYAVESFTSDVATDAVADPTNAPSAVPAAAKKVPEADDPSAGEESPF